MRRLIVIGLLCVVAEATLQARPFRRARTSGVISAPQNAQPSATPGETPTPTSPPTPMPAKDAPSAPLKGVDDALDEVNAERVEQGLPPFLPDPLLNRAARDCARIRATHFIKGHLENDFAYLPAGASAAAAGCGALDPSWGWGTCCTYEGYRYAGAAWVMGADGKRYMHLFVR